MPPEPAPAPTLDGDLAEALRRHQAGDRAGAEAGFRRVLAQAPDHPAALQHLGVLEFQAGRQDEGLALLDRAAAAAPDDPGIQFNRGLALRAAGRLEEAADCYARAAALAPGFADAHNNLGNIRRAQGRLEEARACYAQAVAAMPRHAGAHNNLGTVLQELGDAEAAVAAHRRALALAPRHAGALNNLGNAYRALARLDLALDCYRQAIALAPDLVDAHLNLAGALQQLGQPEPAVAALRRVLELRPDHAEALGALVHARQALCDWDGLADQQRALIEAVERGAVVQPFTLLSLPSTPAQQQRAARSWMAHATAGATPRARPPRPAWDGTRPIRVGYLSSDFREHPTAYLMAELFERHDRGAVTVLAYATGAPDDGPSRGRIAAAADGFVDLGTLPHAAAAQRITDDAIDILVDLNGCTQGARPRLLALRPAPLQVNYLGYPGTMGAGPAPGGFIDYVITDPVVVPEAEHRWLDEAPARLPHSYQVNDGKRPVATPRPTRADCGLPEAGFVFCSFNSAYKIAPDFFAAWMRLLQSVPGSVLWLLDCAPAATANLRREAAAHGVDPARLVFAPSVRFPQHLARQPLADLLLDTLPYGGHTTASDGLWSGVPLVTLRGDAWPGRVGASLLTALGLPELITGSLASYEALARALAGDPPRLAALRARLAAARDAAPLYDCGRFARDVERAYRIMMRRAADGLPPSPILLEPILLEPA